MNAEIDISEIKLETNRLIIRKWKSSDLKDFYEYAKVDGVGQNAGWKPHESIEESKKILDLFIQNRHTFALELKENHKVIGSLGIELYREKLTDELEKLKGREIGYVLNKDYWGKGIMPEAVTKVIQYCFEDLKLDFLLCSHFNFNKQSKRVIEKCGFEFYKDSIHNTQKTKLYILKNKKEI